MDVEDKLIDTETFNVLTHKEDGLLGMGGFGKVFKVISAEKVPKIYALKKINVEHVTKRYLQDSPLQTPMPKNHRTDRKVKKEIWMSLFKEAMLMSHLNHKNIITLYHYYVDYQRIYPHDPRYLYLLLEYSPYGTVYKFIRKQRNKRISEFITKEITSEVINGLIYLSDQRLIHGDIKASNILLFPNGQVKICDFGLSFQFDDENRDHYNDTIPNDNEDNKLLQKIAANGSPYWLAPEIIVHRMATPKSDVWSLGATVIEMLTGNPPFSDYGPLPACHAVGEGAKVEYPAWISKTCMHFLDACFQHNPAKRARAKDLVKYKWISSTKRNILKHIEELNETDNDYTDDFEVYDPRDVNSPYKDIARMSITELEKVEPAKSREDIEVLATLYPKIIKNHIKQGDTDYIEQLLRIGEMFLQQYPQEMVNLCYSGLLSVLAEARRKQQISAPTCNLVETLVTRSVPDKGHEWLLVSGFTQCE